MGGRGQTYAQMQQSSDEYMKNFKEKTGNSKTHDAKTDAHLKENDEYTKGTKQRFRKRTLDDALGRLNEAHGVANNLTQGRILDSRLENHGYKPHVELLNQQMSLVKKYYPKLNINSIGTYSGDSVGKSKINMETGDFTFNANNLSIPRLNKAVKESNIGRDYAHNIQKNLIARSFYQIAKENPVKMQQLKKTYIKDYGGTSAKFQSAFINGMSKYISNKTYGESSSAFADEIGRFLKRLR